jgi:4a-hydroxytetrahydrobiopterin dehydratase
VGVNFAEAVGKVNAIAILAEAADHHPDILIYGWNKIRVTLSTHDAGGLSDKDFELAAKIEEIAY